MKLLMHICCAPCFIAPWKHLKDKIDVTGFWYNPNIQPYTEFRKRLETLRKFCSNENITLLEDNTYKLEEFFEEALKGQENRCQYCYLDRLESTAKTANQKGFTHFSSTLLYSKFQNHELIVEFAKELASKYGIDFYYEDFREYWKEGIELSKEIGMYRQQYCGCIFSERSRYEDYYHRKDAKESGGQ